jgi:hypothetical protein
MLDDSDPYGGATRPVGDPRSDHASTENRN